MKKLKIEGNFDVLRCGGLDISVLEPLASKGSKPSPFACVLFEWCRTAQHIILCHAVPNSNMRNMSKFFCLWFLSPLC